MARWFTADLHFGHGNVIRYCDRPFSNVDEMDQALIERWNAVVRPGDEVWVLGDFALGQIADTLPLASRLAGRKVLLSGNHDRCWPGHGQRADGWEARYLDAGFDEILHGEARVDVGGHRVLVSHFPYRGDSQDSDRFSGTRPVDRGEWLLHGHVHERWRQQGRMINVGVDVWDFTPVSEQAIAELIAAGPTEVVG